ncbi:MAG: hypothetical protein IPL39_13180 [Opitutaceae bacterium]|nr:hypothetical protein [Opitutaceae bacterium]
MKTYATFILMLLLGGCSVANFGQHDIRFVENGIVLPDGDWEECAASEADYRVHIHYSFSAVLEGEDLVISVREKKSRRQVAEPERGSRFLWDGLPDSIPASLRTFVCPGLGYSGSIDLSLERMPFVLDFELFWDAKNGAEHYRNHWKFASLRDGSVSDGRFRADIRIKKRPGQPGATSNDSTMPDFQSMSAIRRG